MSKFQKVEGQLDIWDMLSTIDEPVKENIIAKPLDTVTSINNKHNDKKIKARELTEAQEQWLDESGLLRNKNYSRIILYCGGGLGIEYLTEDGYKTDYINSNGEYEFTCNKKIGVLPMDKVRYFKGSFKSNDLQEKRLEELKADGQVIRREGDENIIVKTDKKVISINSKGWVMDFMGIEVRESSVKHDIKCDNVINVGDSVEVEYRGTIYKGVATHIYNRGDTINCSFNGCNTAFYKDRVKKIVC